MATPEMRLKMAAIIINFEARRDKNGHLAVYKLPPEDGGGPYEVAGINDRYNKDTVDVLVAMIKAGKFAQAEEIANEYIADNTEFAASWTTVPAIEFYLRDSLFNRGAGGAARILQAALGVKVDGAVGKETRDAMKIDEQDAPRLLGKLRAAREQYERTVVKRDEKSKFWKGLVNRWNNALDAAKTFPMGGPAPAPAPAPVFALHEVTAPVAPAPSVLPALRIGMNGPRVIAWQHFLKGQGFDIRAIDGDFGENTFNATSAFQKKYKLSVDGAAGRESLLKAAALGFELIEEPAADNTSSNFPPKPSFAPLVSNAQRAVIFGSYDYVSAPTKDNPEAIRIIGNWQKDNILTVPIPQLAKTKIAKPPSGIQFHRLGAKQLQGMFADWEKAGLLDRILTYDGSYVPRFVRGSRTTLSNHAFGSGFDINYPYNKLGERPALVGEKGSVRELVAIANQWGFWWGGHFDNRKDGMHFEVAFLK